MEIWKDIEGYEGLYQISNMGNAKSISRFRENGNSGYIQKEIHIKVHRNQKYQQFKSINKYIHRLVAQAFIKNPKNKPQVNHIYSRVYK